MIDTARHRYDDWHARYDVDQDVNTPWHRMLLAHLDPGRDLRGRRVLEIACGRGGLAVRLSGFTSPPPAVTAADFSWEAVRKGSVFARSRNSPARWEVADAQSLGHATGTFDTVISCETIEHLPDPQRAMREFARVLKPGGRLFLTCPNYLGPLGLYRMYLRAIGRPYTEEGQPINRLTLMPLTLRQLRRAGLHTVLATATGHYLPLPGRPPREFPSLDRIRPLRWFGLHSLVVAEKQR